MQQAAGIVGNVVGTQGISDHVACALTTQLLACPVTRMFVFFLCSRSVNGHMIRVTGQFAEHWLRERG